MWLSEWMIVTLETRGWALQPVRRMHENVKQPMFDCRSVLSTPHTPLSSNSQQHRGRGVITSPCDGELGNLPRPRFEPARAGQSLHPQTVRFKASICTDQVHVIQQTTKRTCVIKALTHLDFWRIHCGTILIDLNMESSSYLHDHLHR